MSKHESLFIQYGKSQQLVAILCYGEMEYERMRINSLLQARLAGHKKTHESCQNLYWKKITASPLLFKHI